MRFISTAADIASVVQFVQQVVTAVIHVVQTIISAVSKH